MSNAQSTSNNTKHTLIIRILVGAPLLFFGFMHLIGAMPMKPLIEEAGLPMPELMAIAAPLAQTLGGALILIGAFTKLGGAMAIGTMLGAIVTHIKIPNDQWPTPSELDPSIIVPGQEPVFMLAIAAIIILGSLYLIIKGPGAFAFDTRASSTP